jgi:hypothetical protein
MRQREDGLFEVGEAYLWHTCESEYRWYCIAA